MQETLWHIFWLLVGMTMSIFITWWFLLGLLTPFIEAAVSIIVTGIMVTGEFFLTPLRKMYRVCRRWHDHLPQVGKGVLYIAVGVGIFVYDYVEQVQSPPVETDVLYTVRIAGFVYQATKLACAYGGAFLVMGVWNVIAPLLAAVARVFDRTIDISLVLWK